MEEIWAGTLHAYCFSLLSQKAVFDYLGRVAHPIVTFQKSGVLQFEGRAMLEDLTIDKEFGPKRDCTKRIRAFEAAWARLQSDDPGWPQDEVDRTFQAELVSWLTFHKAMLIGELIPKRFVTSETILPARRETALITLSWMSIRILIGLNRSLYVSWQERGRSRSLEM